MGGATADSFNSMSDKLFGKKAGRFVNFMLDPIDLFGGAAARTRTSRKKAAPPNMSLGVEEEEVGLQPSEYRIQI